MPNGLNRPMLRGRGNAQLPLAIVAVLAIVVVLLGKAQSSLFNQARASFTDWTRPALEWVSSPFAGAAEWVGNLGHVFSVYQENLALKDENAKLRQWQTVALVLDDRLKRYQSLLHAVPDPALSSITARVIGRASQPFLDTVIIDAGKAQGVKPGEAVVDARGMMGRIFLAGQHTSWLVLLTDLNSRIPVLIQPGNIQAIMAGDNSRAPIIDTLAQTTRPKAGDQVVTSGDGGLIPPGLPVGQLVADGDGFRVALLADPSTIEDVRIVNFKLAQEQPPAPSPNDLPAAAAGFKPAPPAPPPVPASVTTPTPGTAAQVKTPAVALKSKPAQQAPVPQATMPAVQPDSTAAPADDSNDQ
jgi:rod shape-determining protein MreC